MKEFISLKYLVQNMDINDNTWIIKTSGRYLLEDDTFVTLVKNTNNSTEAIIRSCDNDTQIYTFLFAMRWKFFKEFYELPLSIVSTKNIERVIVEFYENKNIVNSIINIERLDILANINNENKFQIF